MAGNFGGNLPENRVAGLKRMRWSESDLAERRKGDAGKVRLARELRAQSTMPLEWIAKRLQMGSRGYVACLLCRQNKPDDNITKELTDPYLFMS